MSGWAESGFDLFFLLLSSFFSLHGWLTLLAMQSRYFAFFYFLFHICKYIYVGVTVTYFHSQYLGARSFCWCFFTSEHTSNFNNLIIKKKVNIHDCTLVIGNCIQICMYWLCPCQIFKYLLQSEVVPTLSINSSNELNLTKEELNRFFFFRIEQSVPCCTSFDCKFTHLAMSGLTYNTKRETEIFHTFVCKMFGFSFSLTYIENLR